MDTNGDPLPSGMDVDQQDADLDELTSPFVTDPDTQPAADVSQPLAARQGQAPAQQARPTPRKKPENWKDMSRSQQVHWNKRVRGKRLF